MILGWGRRKAVLRILVAVAQMAWGGADGAGLTVAAEGAPTARPAGR